MPCWYYDKKELRNTPSLRDGIDFTTEARYRKEGARFIIDCGTKLGLRYDSCATGVVFFQRFYMFHSFKEFHRYVTAACCLFLAGKTEETPKKCKDIIKTTRSMLTEAQLSVFGKEPKEEVMTMERVLLQTIKFDLMVEHPYAYLLKFAKLMKGKGSEAEKAKIQKLVQMAWTFINDSLCTMLCLQWEPEVVAISLMYLATRLNKSDITDWVGKPVGFKGKWWEGLVEGVNQELLEDVCHQVLDLYQSTPAAKPSRDNTPPPPPPKPGAQSSMTTSTGTKRSRSPSIGESTRSRGPTPSKAAREDKRPPSPQRSSSKDRDRSSKHSVSRSSSSGASSAKTSRPTSTNSGPATPSSIPAAATTPASSYSQNNPYMSQNMYSSSFMSQEGSQSIQSLVGGRASYGGYAQPPPTQPPAAPVSTVPTTTTYTQPTTYQPPTYPAPSYQQPQPTPQQPNYQQPPPATGYGQSSTFNQSYTCPPSQPQYPRTTQYQTQQQAPPPAQSYTGSYNMNQYNTGQRYRSNYNYNAQNYNTQPYQGTPQATQPPQPPPMGGQPHMTGTRPGAGLAPVRIAGRPP